MPLSKDEEKLLGVIYKEYKARLKSGKSQREAVNFEFEWQRSVLPDVETDYLVRLLSGIKREFGIRLYQRGSFLLNDRAIEYMESKKRKTAEKIIGEIAKGIGLIRP